MKINLQGIERDVVICFARLFHTDLTNRIETKRIEDLVLDFLEAEKKEAEYNRLLAAGDETAERKMKNRVIQQEENEGFFDFDMEFDRYRTNW